MNHLTTNSNSHDTLEIINHLGQCCVKKTFRKNLSRANQNIEKQINFENIQQPDQLIKSVTIIERLISCDKIEIIMPYIEGLNGPSFTLNGTADVAKKIKIGLEVFLSKEIANSVEKLIKTSVFQSKLTEILSATGDLILINIVRKCQLFLGNMPDQMLYPVGECHGDLTLSNIILSDNGQINLIDFLATYLETPLQDIAKIKQEFKYGWSIRYEENWLALKGRILGDSAVPNIVEKIDKQYPIQSKIIMIVTLARIAPYVKDQITHNWLIKSISSELKI